MPQSERHPQRRRLPLGQRGQVRPGDQPRGQGSAFSRLAKVRQAPGLNHNTGAERALVSRTSTLSAPVLRPTSTQSVPPFAL